eukprot:4418318-Pyramimonas_sp.AAC.1
MSRCIAFCIVSTVVLRDSVYLVAKAFSQMCSPKRFQPKRDTSSSGGNTTQPGSFVRALLSDMNSANICTEEFYGRES